MSINYKLTVCIISYNRPNELARAIKSLLPLPENVEIVISDDKSPKIKEILLAIEDIIEDGNIRFISNEQNLGYDRNLYRVIELSAAEHVLLLGDDDYLEKGTLNNVIDFINKNIDLKCGFLRFSDNKFDSNQVKYSRAYTSSKYFNSNALENDGSFIYNSILFSGLIFSKSPIIDNQSIFSKYFHSIYIQVAIFGFLNSNYGSYYIYGPGVIIGGDGENGFGFNEASMNLDSDLKDRSSLISNLSYHKRLFKVIRDLEKDTNQNIFKPFLLEYKIRSVKALFEERKSGRKRALKYFKELSKLKISGIWLFYPAYLLVIYLPIIFLIYPISLFQKILQKFRIIKVKNIKTIK
jgi:hypothetical protein